MPKLHNYEIILFSLNIPHFFLFTSRNIYLENTAYFQKNKIFHLKVSP